MAIKLQKNTSIYLKNTIKSHFLTLLLVFTLWNNNHVILLANHEALCCYLVTKPYPYPGGLRSVGSHRVGYDWSNLAAVAAASHIQLTAIPWTIAHQAPLSMGFPRQEHWSRLPFPSPGDLPNPQINPAPYLLHWQVDSLPLSHQGNPIKTVQTIVKNPSRRKSSLNNFYIYWLSVWCQGCQLVSFWS